MFIMESFAYMDIAAEVYQYKEKFIVKFRTEDFVDISLTLNHTQIKVLADGLMAMANQAKLKEIWKNQPVHDMGDMKVKFGIIREVDEQCLQNILSARTGIVSLSETA